MPLTKNKIDGLRAMYHNAGSSANEKASAKSILEKNGVSVDMPKKSSGGGTGTNPGYAKGGFDTGNGSFEFEFADSGNYGDAFNNFFREAFGQGKTEQPKEKVIFINNTDTLCVLYLIESKVAGSLRMDALKTHSDGKLYYHFNGLSKEHQSKIISVYQNGFVTIAAEVKKVIERHT